MTPLLSSAARARHGRQVRHVGKARRVGATVVVLLGVLFGAREAQAREADPDGFAKHALSRARADYRARNYDRGAARLEAARSACGSDACSPMLAAAVLLELGAMEFKRGHEDAVPALFSKARTLAGDLPFTHYDEPDLNRLWVRASAEKPEEAPAPQSAPAAKHATKAPVEPPEVQAWAGKPRRFARLWLGISAAADFPVLTKAENVCKLAPNGVVTNSVHAFCTNPDGSDFPNRGAPAQNDALVPGKSGTLNGGLGIPDVRLLVSADYAPAAAFLVGLRLGYVFDTYTGAAAPEARPSFRRNLHMEARATYLFGPEPLARTGFSPMIFAAIGTSDFAGHTRSFVSSNGIAGRAPVDVWVVAGPWFAALGGGARYQFSPRVAFTAALRLSAAFGDVGSLFTVGPELGIAYGF